MPSLSTTHSTLSTTVWPDNSLLRNIVLAFAGSMLLAISAHINVLTLPVPVTMQTFVVLGLGAALGWRLAGATVLLYLSQGALGLPVFAEGAGIAYMAGPTGGYLLGFLIAAVVVGRLAEHGMDRTPAKMFPAMLIGNFLIYVPGVIWLASFFGMQAAFAVGVLPFLLTDVLKCALAAIAFPLAWKHLIKDKSAES